jgi:uncharacterized membrane protein
MEVSKGEGWLRLPSVFASMLSLALTAAFSQVLFGRQTTLTAVALLAVAPLSVWYAQEARMVIFVAPFALLIGLGLVRGGWRGGALLFLGLAGGLYFDYVIVPLWVVLSGLWLVEWWYQGREGRPLMIWLAGSLAAWLFFWPLWSHLALVVGRLGNIFVIANIREQLGLPDLGMLLYLMGLVALGFAAFGAGWMWRRVVERRRLCEMVTVISLAGCMISTLLMAIRRLYRVKRLVVRGWRFVF